MAYTRCRVKRAKLATEPEMSAITKISGLAGPGWRKRGSIGTPPVESERRMVARKSSGPLRPWRRLRARRTASLRDSGCSTRCSMASSSRVACMTSMSSGSGLRTERASASAPRSSTRRRRISVSTARRNFSMRALYSSAASRSSRSVSEPPAAPACACAHQPLQHGVEVEVPQRAVEVVGAADRPPGLHAGVAVDGVAGHHVHQRGVGRQQRLEEQLGQLLGRHALARRRRPSTSGPGPAAALRPACSPSPSAPRPRLAPRPSSPSAAGPHGEEDLEGRLEGAPVRGRLHQRGGQRVLQGLAVLERDVVDRLGGVEVLGQRDRQPGAAQLGDEPGQEVEHGRLSSTRPTAAPWPPARCRSGT